ncbi:tRNA (adenosine(37)-N6)-threonylcarbamoyltransferase complex transferase subunit TsaD, partial [Staphylococcus aureus]|nr:tRNA (adenosine(37)-N6)-threonylcarbamoyltransferase complex transferase subunit TsaD [Staphylococcus aureus]
SQIEIHKRFGGVVPEVASIHHVEGITTTINEALVYADVSMEDIDAIEVTEVPGLIGEILIGVNEAKALEFSYDKPL